MCAASRWWIPAVATTIAIHFLRTAIVYGLCLAGIGPHARAQGAGDLPQVAILSPDPTTAADPASMVNA
jgi:hypothetical protein